MPEIESRKGMGEIMALSFASTVLILGIIFGAIGGGIIYWITHNWKATVLTASIVFVTALPWLLQEVFK